MAATRIATAGAIGVLLLLAALHLLSPEFGPSWRMVSEYANGSYSWVLSLMFLSWATSTWALAAAVRPHARSRIATAGVVMLVVAGIGEAMAAFFDINHGLHSVASALGILGLPIAAMFTGVSLAKDADPASRRRLLWTSNLTWISVVLMAASFGLFFAALKGAGITMSADAKPLSELPDGVTAFVGWANRLLIVAYCAWAIVVARHVARSRTR